MKFLRKINLDINKDLYNPIQVKQNDTARYLLFNLLDNGVPFSLENKTVRVYGLKPDGTKVFNNLTIINAARGLAELQLTTQMLVKPGCLKLELVIYEATDILSTTKFDIDIISCIRDDGAIESTNEFSALTVALAKADEYGKALKQGTENIELIYATELNGVKSQLEEKAKQLKDININVKTIPNVKYDGVTDDSLAIQTYIDNTIFSTLTLMFPSGTCLANITINKKNITITGYGTIKGYIYIDETLNQDLNYNIEKVTFVKNISDYGIRLNRARVGNIEQCIFDSTLSKGIYFNETPSYNQYVNRLTIDKNKFYGEYSIYIENNNANKFSIGDLHFQNNVCVNKICNFYAKGLDGLVFIGNTCFLPGYQTNDVNKTNNIYINFANWLNIEDNNLFEAGLESIFLSKIQNPTIAGNNIAWGGQRVPSSAIRVKDGDTIGDIHTSGLINDNNIMFPTLHGISIEGNTGGMEVSDNRVKFAGASSYYYGSENLSSINHYGINVEVTTRDIIVIGNNTKENINNVLGAENFYDLNFDKDKNLIRKYRVLTLNNTSSTISVKGVEGINLTQPSPTNISNIVDGYEGQTITMYAFNSNTTINVSSTVLLKDGASVNIPINRNISLRFNSGKWWEIGRSF